MSTPPAPSADFRRLLDQRLVRYADLRPCTTAFVDTRTPGSREKENFTIIGPGVAENPDQYVHISIPHGFNIGGARQPPGCVNSQHSHETAEVFVVHSGTWTFRLGPNGEDGAVTLEPGDAISIPTQVFRGFENTGDTTGFLFAVLGGDDPGKVTWAPYVFAAAEQYGLVLLEDGSLVDTTVGESVPPDKKPMPITTDEDVKRLRRMTAEELKNCVFPGPGMRSGKFATPVNTGLAETPVIGAESPAEGLPAGMMRWPHGFHLRHVRIEPGQSSRQHARSEEEVIFVQNGGVRVQLGAESTLIGTGDTLTVPIDMPRRYSNDGDTAVELFIVRGSDAPAAARIL